MKKIITGLVAAVLALALLCGCGESGNMGRSLAKAFEPEARAGKSAEFQDIEYVRPGTEGLEALLSELDAALQRGSLNKVMALLDKCYGEYYNFYTMYNLADIRACQDMKDEYYAAEYAWCDDNFSRMGKLMEEMFYACAESELAGKLEEQYFWPGFAADYADKSKAVYSGEILELMSRESALLAEYRALTASPTIQGDGLEVDYYSYIEDLYEEDYSEALLQYYRKYNGELSRIYIELVKLRRELAEKLGYDSYEQMQYYYYFERDYSPEEAAGYIADIKEHMVPLYKEVMAGDPYAGVRYNELSEEGLMQVLGSAAVSLGGEIGEAWSFMESGGFYDVRVSPQKASMSFQTYLSDYEAPFLFLDAYGDTEDILSLSHEFGHYVDAYVNYDAYETIDVSECFSQGMEYLLLSRYDGVLSEEELDNLYRLKMLDTLELYVQQASFAEFESIVYSTEPEKISAEFLNGLSLSLAKDYGYYDGESEEYYALSWTDVVHFFELPFYIISYPVSNDVAMQIYELEQREEGLGLSKYLEILPRDYEGLIDTVTAGGLSSPFEPGRVEKAVDDLSRLLTLPRAA